MMATWLRGEQPVARPPGATCSTRRTEVRLAMQHRLLTSYLAKLGFASLAQRNDRVGRRTNFSSAFLDRRTPYVVTAAVTASVRS